MTSVISQNEAAEGAGPAAAAGTFRIGEGPVVRRLGFGAMRITGPGVWGPPADPKAALDVLRRAVDLGVNLIDTADSYGPETSEQLIREALHPYDGLTIATKAGQLRPGPGQWTPCGRPEYLRQQCELSLRRLDVERIDLFQLHRVDPTVPAADQFGVLAELEAEGKIAEVGLSEVSVETIEQARGIVDVATVQNRYNLVDRASDDVLRYCTENGIGFLPWHPVAAGALAEPGGAVAEIAWAHGVTAPQVALAWLLQRSSVMLPIPGTADLAHLEDNCRAAELELDLAEIDRLDAGLTEL
ncbi:aldo/keto reductase [Pseudonocardia sp. RS11V-5]|uniref:aldo/keto reductase n=1 Tax=Pseudonocardia terrae TaxID=2905831 RepID=UPI001E4D6057|nr:aldo/keto reductase [Pseudonocardia terrae]MCE3553514.1 aldo/keto reductase [Pseudonocardia terrae]